MSYDLRLVIDTGGKYPALVTDIMSPTYNLREMFELSLGMPIKQLEDKLANDAAPIILAAINAMKKSPAKFKKLNPPNGWGNYEQALNSLEWLHEMCIENPKATVKI